MKSTLHTQSFPSASEIVLALAGILVLGGCSTLPIDLESDQPIQVVSASQSYGTDVILTRTATPRAANKSIEPTIASGPESSLIVRDMAGPFESIQAYCDTAGFKCEDTLGSLAGPSEVVVKDSQARVFRGADFCHLGIEKNGAWFVADKVAWCGTETATDASIVDVDFLETREAARPDLHLTLRDVSGDGQLNETLIVCGSGQQATPSCAYIPTAIEDLESESRVTLSFHHDGQVSVEADGDVAHTELASIVGQHGALFP